MAGRLDIDSVAARLGDDRPVRRALPGWGRVHVDRRLPFLCVYRRPVGREDPGTDRLVLGEAAYVRASATWDGLEDLVRAVADAATPVFGAFLVVEIWADERLGRGGRPAFEIHAPRPDMSAAQALARVLGATRLDGSMPALDIVQTDSVAPPALPPLAGPGHDALGLAVAPVHRDRSGRLLPAILAQLQRSVARAIKEAVFVFVKEQTTHRPAHFHALGRRAVTRAVWEADRRLAAVARKLDFMLMVTPVNADAAWKQFRRSEFDATPAFRYRPWPGDPVSLLHDLYSVPVQRIEDPTLRDLIEQKRVQLGRKIAMLRDRGTPAFLYGSLQVWGGVDAPLEAAAREVLGKLSGSSGSDSGGHLDAEAFAALARDEIAHYRAGHARFTARVEVRSDVPGLMTSRGNLLVGASLRVPARRARALIEHEIGTHLVCDYNARAQPFQLLRLGLPGYDDLQEGLAVLAEHLVGGLSRSRLRILAGRVLGVRRAIDGASFGDLFAELKEAHGFGSRTAFMLAMRSLRGGGLTRDAAYLRGLLRLFRALREGLALEGLFVGKVALEHVAVVEELQWRGVLGAAPVRPRFLDDEPVRRRLERLAGGAGLMDLCEDAA